MTRAFHRSYVHGLRRAGQVTRLHVMREDGSWAGKRGLCGAHGWGVTRSEPIIVEPLPATPPDGLSWCPPCVGKLAELRGVLPAWAADLAGDVR